MSAPPEGDLLRLPQPSPPPRRRRVSGGQERALVVVFLVLLVGVIGTLVHLPYAVMSPGPTTNVLGTTTGPNGATTDLIVISGHPTYPTTGSLDFTTVRISGGPGFPVNVWDVLRAWVDSTREVYPVDAVFPPDATQEGIAQENQAEMVDSQQEATAVALRKAGFPVTERVSIGSVSPDAPSGTAFQQGDVLVSIGGAAVTSADAARTAIQKVTPGSSVAVVVERGGRRVPVTAKTGTVSGRTVLGVVLKIDYTFPFNVKIDAGNVGGPSAGLMFSLGIYDRLTPGPLTGGVNIAGTGTITGAGVVGPIGGIRQKMVGARQGGATWFLAPAANCDEVRDNVPDGLHVVKVATFDEGESAVEHIGKADTAALPAC